MAFKLYQNKSSLDRKYSRLVAGGTTELIGNFLGWWEKADIPTNFLDDGKFTITKEFEHRPDKIAYYVYGREDFMWLVLQYNNIVDINEELVSGKVLKLPSYSRAMYNLVNK
jgi:hypothetical protein